MKWIAKALVQKVLSGLPQGDKLNYLLQRKTGGLPVSQSEFVEKVGYAHDRLRKWEKFGNSKPLNEIHCFEFGAGWDLIGPLAYWSFGVEHQTVIDIRRNLRPELLSDTVQKFREYREQCEAATGRQLRTIPRELPVDPERLLQAFGIDYRAPLDASETGLPSNSIDFISTNSTLEHIPAESLARILPETRRLLFPDGIACHFVDLKDHFSYFDSSITKYEFLTHSDAFWSVVNSSISYQNRLRYADYHRLFRDAKLRLIDEEVRWGTEEDMRAFRSLRLTSRFAKSDTDEHLAVQVIGVVLGK